MCVYVYTSDSLLLNQHTPFRYRKYMTLEAGILEQ